jgi:hypothetical protein
MQKYVVKLTVERSLCLEVIADSLDEAEDNALDIVMLSPDVEGVRVNEIKEIH